MSSSKFFDTWSFLTTQPMRLWYKSKGNFTGPLPYFFSICFFFSLICCKRLPTIILKLLHFYRKILLESKTALKKRTAILLPLSLLSCQVNHFEYITRYSCEHIANKISQHTIAKKRFIQY